MPFLQVSDAVQISSDLVTTRMNDIGEGVEEINDASKAHQIESSRLLGEHGTKTTAKLSSLASKSAMDTELVGTVADELESVASALGEQATTVKTELQKYGNGNVEATTVHSEAVQLAQNELEENFMTYQPTSSTPKKK